VNVVHCKREPFDVYIGRPSIFGNPYTHKDRASAEYKVATREEAIKCFREYFLRRVEIDAEFRAAVMELRGKTLGCWCKPEACHGDVIREYLERL